MFSYSTSEEKVLYQCYGRENFILKLRRGGGEHAYFAPYHI